MWYFQSKMFRITAALREYFNYRYDDASFRLEEAKLNGLRVPVNRDFRPRADRLADSAESGILTSTSYLGVSNR